jgi:hypothetical protein
MAEQRWSSRFGTPPGVIRLNQGHIVMLKTLVATFTSHLNGELDQALSQLNNSLYARSAAGNLSWQDAAKQLHALAGKMLPVLEKVPLDRHARMKILLTLVDESRVHGYADYANAEQAYMAIVSVSNGLIQDGTFKLTPEIRSALVGEYAFLSNDRAQTVSRLRHSHCGFRARWSCCCFARAGLEQQVCIARSHQSFVRHHFQVPKGQTCHGRTQHTAAMRWHALLGR